MSTETTTMRSAASISADRMADVKVMGIYRCVSYLLPGSYPLHVDHGSLPRMHLYPANGLSTHALVVPMRGSQRITNCDAEGWHTALGEVFLETTVQTFSNSGTTGNWIDSNAQQFRIRDSRDSADSAPVPEDFDNAPQLFGMPNGRQE